MSPTCLYAWTEEFLIDIEWDKVYKLSFEISREPYLQSFQYKVLNRILNCNERLHTWQIKDTNLCIFCDKIDTIEHHLYYCIQSRIFWNRIEKWMLTSLETKINLTGFDVIFGLQIQRNSIIDAFNYIILLGKYFINKSRTNEKPLYFIDFLRLLKEKIECIIEINNTNSWGNQLWQEKLYAEL